MTSTLTQIELSSQIYSAIGHFRGIESFTVPTFGRSAAEAAFRAILRVRYQEDGGDFDVVSLIDDFAQLADGGTQSFASLPTETESLLVVLEQARSLLSLSDLPRGVDRGELSTAVELFELALDCGADAHFDGISAGDGEYADKDLTMRFINRAGMESELIPADALRLLAAACLAQHESVEALQMLVMAEEARASVSLTVIESVCDLVF